MAPDTLRSDRIGPTIDLETVTLPPPVAGGLADLYDAAEPVDTAEAWVDATRSAFGTSLSRQPTTEDLCTAADGDHVFEPAGGDATQAYVCVLDPMIYPFITDTSGTVRSAPQQSTEEIEVEIDSEGVRSSHRDAVLSIGVSDDADRVEPVTPEVVYRRVCGYVHAFADEPAYESWAADVDAATTSVHLDRGVGVAWGLADALFASSAAV